ncbi:MAG: hypothetical protein H6677_00545 [Candidatus Obscuribacterales bacterium]|nr:hypothetical protein [Candidatus Obscuribacterales bacterium]
MQVFHLTIKSSIVYVIQRARQLFAMLGSLLNWVVRQNSLSNSDLEQLILVLENGKLIAEDLIAAIETITRAVRRQLESQKSVSSGSGDCPKPGDGLITDTNPKTRE